MNNIPIVLMHSGDSFYLKYCIQSIRKSNPNSKIFLIGENVKEEYEGVEKHDLNNYKKYARQIEKDYVHFNTSNPKIELFCIKRWFILLDFMEKNNIKEICASDSDVILYQNLENDRNFFNKYDYVLAKGQSAGFSFFSNINVLRAYVKFVNDFYDNKFYLKKYSKIRSITDMFFWGELKNIDYGKDFVVGDISTIINSKVYCTGILNKQNNITMHRGMKKIFFVDKKPFVMIYTPNKMCKNFLDYLFGGDQFRYVELKSVHCQAGTKFYMKYFLNGKCGLREKLQCELMRFLRNNLSPIMPIKLRNFCKKIMHKVF